jgi:3-phosphoshikimate 1-carboxyvinyltransferase
MLNSLGASVTVTKDGLMIDGRDSLSGGHAHSYNDHRIAMSAAVASTVSRGAVTLTGAEAVEKSYPRFWDDISSLGIILELNSI